MSPDPEAESGVRLSHRLVALHAGGIVILLLAVLSSVLWISREHNLLALESSQDLVRGGIASFRVRLRTLVQDYSIWDEAYAAVQARDREWLYSNIGNAARDIGTLDLIEIIDPTTGETFGWREGSPVEGEPSLLPAPLLRSVLAVLDAPNRDSLSRTLLAELNGEPWAFSAARIRPVAGAPNGRQDDLPVQVHGIRLNDRMLKQIGDSLLVDGLRLAKEPNPRLASIELRDGADQTIGYVEWVPPRPGASILRQVTLPLILALLTVATISGISARYAVRSARRLEEALKAATAADRSKTEFLSNVSHELRTPMNGILGVAQLLETTSLDDEQRELVGLLFTSANAQMALISDLLDFSRIESGNRQLVDEPFEPAAVLHDVVEMIRVAADRKHVRLVTRWDAIGSLSARGDARAFRQIMTNLLGNAVKFTEQGQVTLEVSQRRDGDLAWIAVRVSDTGRGIPEEALPLIFERFYQVDSSLARTSEGTGLGLAISQNLARMMGGRIEVESVPGRGSTFTFTAPYEVIGSTGDARDAA